MMQNYDLASDPEAKSTNTSSSPAGTPQTPAPSKKAVQNILNFARCYQCVNVQNLKIKLYLN